MDIHKFRPNCNELFKYNFLQFLVMYVYDTCKSYIELLTENYVNGHLHLIHFITKLVHKSFETYLLLLFYF